MVNLIVTVFHFTITVLNCDVTVLIAMSAYPVFPGCVITIPQYYTNMFYYYKYLIVTLQCTAVTSHYPLKLQISLWCNAPLWFYNITMHHVDCTVFPCDIKMHCAITMRIVASRCWGPEHLFSSFSTYPDKSSLQGNLMAAPFHQPPLKF